MVEGDGPGPEQEGGSGPERGDADVLAAIGEEYSATILAATDRPRSARELSELLDVPIATCYRRIEALVAAGLLAEHGRELSDRGRRTSVYRRTVDGVSLRFDDDSYEVTVDPNEAADGTRPGDR